MTKRVAIVGLVFLNLVLLASLILTTYSPPPAIAQAVSRTGEYILVAGESERTNDAVYLLADAMYAAGSVPQITGADIARGMQRVVAGSLDVDIGPTHIADGFSALATGGTIRLNGTMGPSDFDPGVGARRGSGSVYCYLREDLDVTIAYDVLRHDRDTGELVGELPCFEGF